MRRRWVTFGTCLFLIVAACERIHMSRSPETHDLAVASRQSGFDGECETPDPPDREIAPLEAQVSRIMPLAIAEIQIPTYVWVITSGSTGNVSDTSVNTQILFFNQAMMGLPASANTTPMPFRLVLQRVTRVNNSSWYRMVFGSAAEAAMKRAHRVSGKNILNIYVVGRPQGNLTSGWSTFPWSYASNPNLDGVVLRNDTLPRDTADTLKGDTGIHEVGHWIGLFHTFRNFCNRVNDLVDDTPAEAHKHFDCPAGHDSCSLPGLDPLFNFMCYSKNSCRRQFTPGQAARMRQKWAAYRAP